MNLFSCLDTPKLQTFVNYPIIPLKMKGFFQLENSKRKLWLNEFCWKVNRDIPLESEPWVEPFYNLKPLQPSQQTKTGRHSLGEIHIYSLDFAKSKLISESESQVMKSKLWPFSLGQQLGGSWTGVYQTYINLNQFHYRRPKETCKNHCNGFQH